MLKVAVMIEGQIGLNWARWQRVAHAVEDLGFAALHRSDHFTNPSPPDLDSLELWVSLTWLASHTERIEFGPLVSPISFRHPVFTARLAKDVDDLSGGRLVLGVGAGWEEREHTNFGFDLLDLPRRFERFEEGLEIITRLLHSDVPVDFDGTFFRLNDAILLPRPQRPGGPPILIGGNGPRRTLPLVARFADQWNGVFLTAERFAELSNKLDELLDENDRRPGDVRRSLMAGLIVGRDEAELQANIQHSPYVEYWGHDPDELRARGLIVGVPADIVDQLGRLAEVGAERVMLQWLDLDDLDGLENLARSVLPQLEQ
jgi:F420-dependent oxidoreductase-like protein